MNTLSRKKDAGGVIIISAIVALLMMALTMGYLLVTVGFVNTVEASVNEERALQVAEAGIDLAVDRLNKEVYDDITEVDFGDGKVAVSVEYWGNDGIDNDGDGHIDDRSEMEVAILTSLGFCGTRMRHLEAVVNGDFVNGPLLNAVYSGNDSGDPNYSLDFGGTGGSADEITGDIYSGNDLWIRDDAVVDGTPRARGNLNGSPDNAEYAAPITPEEVRDAMANYPAMVVPVNSIFANQGVSAYDVIGNERFGGTVVPDTSPAHIFRLDPDDRAAESASTDGPDFFLEDPYEVNAQGWYNVNNTPISLSSVQSGDPEEGNDRIYYIEGNLWVYSHQALDFVVKHPEKTGIHVSIVVEGNIYFTENFYFNNQIYDALIFMSLEDPDNPGTTGNVYLGGPTGNSIEELHGFIYAENDVEDRNYDDAGSYPFYTYGSLTAGDKVILNRDYERNGQEYHSPIEIEFDERLTEDSQQATKFRSQLPEFLQDLFHLGPSVREAFYIVSYRELSRPSVNPFLEDEG